MFAAAQRLSLLKSFGIFTMAVRNNHPWHRSNFRPNYFPFYLKKKQTTSSIQAREQTRSGRLILMRRVLQEKHFLGWNHETQPGETRLSNPL